MTLSINNLKAGKVQDFRGTVGAVTKLVENIWGAAVAAELLTEGECIIGADHLLVDQD